MRLSGTIKTLKELTYRKGLPGLAAEVRWFAAWNEESQNESSKVQIKAVGGKRASSRHYHSLSNTKMAPRD
jgi:hypothetical protein